MPPLPIYDLSTKDNGIAQLIAGLPDAFFGGIKAGNDYRDKRLTQEADAAQASGYLRALGLGSGAPAQPAPMPSANGALGLGEAPAQESKIPAFAQMQGQNFASADPKEKLFNTLVKGGLSPVAATGLLGNLAQESRFNAGALNRGDGRDGSDSIGLAQWNADRARGLMQFASSKGLDWRDPELQGQYMLNELNTTEGRTKQALMNARTPEEAAAVGIGYFRPAGWTSSDPMAAHGAQNRVEHAQAIAQRFGVSENQQASMPVQGGFEAQSTAAAPQGMQVNSNLEALKMQARNMLQSENPVLKQRGVVLAQKIIELQQKQFSEPFSYQGGVLQRGANGEIRQVIAPAKPTSEVDQRLKEAQINRLNQQFVNGGEDPAVVKEFNFAKKNGFEGNYNDFLDRKSGVNIKGSEPAAIAPETADWLAEQVLAGNSKALVNLGRGAQGSANILAIQDRVAQKAKDRGLDASDALAAVARQQGYGAQERSMGTRVAALAVAATEAEKGLNLVKEASSKVYRNGFVPIAQLQEVYRKNTNDPDYRSFVAAQTSFINMYARAISPTGVPTVHDKEKAYTMLNSAYDQKSYDAVLDMLGREIQIAKNAPIDARKFADEKRIEAKRLVKGSSTQGSGEKVSDPLGIR